MPNPVDMTDNTKSIHNLGNFIMSYEARQNAFLNALVNRIGMTIVTSRMWNNPYAVFKRGYLEFGESVEEIFVNIAKPFSFDPEVAEKEVFKREIPDVRAAFHQMNFQKFYKVTISNDQLRQAFLSWSGITDLIARIVDSLYTAMNLDEFLVTKYMLCREALNGGMYVVTTEDVATNPADALKKYREYTNNLTFLKSTYNRAQVRNSTPIDRQIIIVPNAVEAEIGVEELAAAFNLQYAEYLGRRIAIDSFEFDADDTERLAELFADDPDYEPFDGAEITALQAINAIKVDREWFMIFDNFNQFTENYNGQGLYWQYFYHVWRIFSVSPFANAIAFTSQESEITEVTVSPESSNLAQGSELQLTATVSGNGLYEKSVEWTISSETELASGTSINPLNGVLHIAKNETVGATITVTATAVDGQSGQSTITVIVA